MKGKPEAPKLLGRAERLDFPELDLQDVPARVDTGAKTAAIWASVNQKSDALEVVFFGPDSPYYTGQAHIFTEFDRAVVANSTGEIQERFKVRLLIRLKGRKVRAWFTLADRSTQVYPVLIGRNVLMGKFVVDVKQGKTLEEAERARTKSLRARFNQAHEEET